MSAFRSMVQTPQSAFFPVHSSARYTYSPGTIHDVHITEQTLGVLGLLLKLRLEMDTQCWQHPAWVSGWAPPVLPTHPTLLRPRARYWYRPRRRWELVLAPQSRCHPWSHPRPRSVQRQREKATPMNSPWCCSDHRRHHHPHHQRRRDYPIHTDHQRHSPTAGNPDLRRRLHTW
ncbi:hypothetical protein BJY00DRAFT_221181 [Aspergillus carlsbadensis]|nr:hypothetical protein BJY00DRAFT_221181 [Aspergillus carlsbadensis]